MDLPLLDATALYFALQHFGVAVSAIAGVLAARGRRVDLFGVVVLGLVTALGGFGRAASAIALIYVVGLCLLPFAPETKGKPLPE